MTKNINNVKSTHKKGTTHPYFLTGGGEMGQRMREFDWSKTALGELEIWPQSLCTAVGIVLNSAIPMFIWWSEKDLVYIYNDAYSHLLGKKHPDSLGKSGKIIWAELWNHIGPMAEEVFSNGNPVYMKDLPLLMDRGAQEELLYFTFSYSPIRDESENVVGLFCTVIETTKDVLAEAALKLERQRLYDLFMQAPVAIMIFRGLNHIVELINPGMCELVGLQLEQVINKPIFEVLPDTVGQGYQDILNNVLRTGNPFKADGIMANLLRNGVLEKAYFNVVYQPVYELDGTISGVLAISTEISDQILALQETKKLAEQRKRVSEKLRRQLRVTAAITDMATACLFIIDDLGKITYMNPSAEKTTMYTSKEAIGKSLHSLLHHSHPDGTPYLESDCLSADTYKHGKSCSLREDTLFRKDGTMFDVLITGTSIPGKAAHLASVIEFRDITDDKIAKRKQLELIAITEQHNALLKLNKTKDEFIALASHQLRTPATAVKQYIALLMDEYAGPLSADQIKYLQIADDSNERQLRIVDELLKTAQIDSSKYTFNKKQHNISEIIQESISDMQSSFDLKNQTVTFDSFGTPIQVNVDVMEMKLAFINLLENSCKYSFPNTKITVSMKYDKDYVEVAIMDKGVGISKKDQKRIFDKFTRVDNQLSDTVSGTGLGLYWVKQIVEMHQGNVKLISKLGVGSQFIIRLNYD